MNHQFSRHHSRLAECAADVLFTCNDKWQARYNWQSHGATVVVNTTAEVEYTDTDGLAGILGRVVLVFPKEQGFAFDYGANGGKVDAIGRVAANGYDGVNRLVEFARGDLNNPKSAIENPKSAEDWSLDMTGNWPGFVQKTSGSTDLDQGRTHNPVNEITAITATTGTNWAEPAHDRAGNMTTIPKPANLADGLTAIYDAWNRLV